MICPECGTGASRWALHCPKCKARFPAAQNRWLAAAAGVFLFVALAALFLRSGVLGKLFSPAPVAAPGSPAAEGPGFEVSLPITLWKTQAAGEIDWAGAGAVPALAIVRREGLAYGAVFVEPGELSAEALALLALDRLKTRGEGFLLARREPWQLAGESAQLAEFSLQSGGVTIRYLAAYAGHAGKGYQAVFWCLDPDWADYRSEFEKILAGWRWED